MWVLVAVAACGTSANESVDGADAPPMDGNFPSEPATCSVDSDCLPAASTCCECPSFSVTASDPFGDGCGEVNCEGLREENCSLLVDPVCVQGQCELACRPLILEADEICELGFERDEFGCATKTCATSGTDPGNTECTVDTDCVQVAADCCGCEMGGADTAVPAGEATSFQAGLGCTGGEVCPGVFVCDADVIPQCLGGACVLAALAPDMGPGAPTPCGLSELSPCPAGQVCVLNDPESNDDGGFGVGVCRSE